MNKQDLVNAIVEARGGEVINKRTVDALLTDIFNVMSDTLLRGDKVTLQGIGIVSVKQSAERQCRNPRTGESFTAPAAKKLKITTAKGFKEALNTP